MKGEKLDFYIYFFCQSEGACSKKQAREGKEAECHEECPLHARTEDKYEKKKNTTIITLGKSTSTKKQKKGDEDSASIPITFACGIYDGGVQKQLNRRTRVALSLWKWDVPYMSSARNDRNFLSIFLNLTQYVCVGIILSTG